MGRQMLGEKYNCVFMYILEFEKVRRFYIFLNTDCFCKHLEKRNFIESIRQNFLISSPLHPRENYLLYEVQNFEYILLDTYYTFLEVVHSVI